MGRDICRVRVSLLVFIIISIFIATSYSEGILGCGGFLRGCVDIEFSKVQVKLYTKQGSLKYQTDCAPNNGYYFMPVYDKGAYVIKIDPPDGWSFEPAEVALSIDGTTDVCSQGKDIDFTFKGFGITGQVISLGSSDGPAGVTVTLTSDDSQEHSQVTTGSGGRFTFSPVSTGDYRVSASHPVWRFARQETRVSVRRDNGHAGQQLAVAGFDVSGQVVSGAESVSDVTFVLHGSATAPLAGCDAAPPVGYAAPAGLPAPLCRVVSDAQGRFLFPVVPSGQYTVVPFYMGAKTRFDVRPARVEVTVAQDSASVAEPFQVAGFSISGRVLTSVDDDEKLGLGGATVLLDGRKVAVTDAEGRYVVESANSGQFRLTVEAESVQFEWRTVTVSPSQPVLLDAVAAAFRVCGHVDLADLPDGVSPGPRSVELRLVGSETAYTAVTEASGAFCVFVRPASYRLRVVVSDDERKRGLSFGSAQQDLTVSAPVSGIQLSPFRARVSGAVRCLRPCAELSVTLVADGLPPRRAPVAADGNFYFDDVLPGRYEVAAVKEEWCWQTIFVPVTVATSDVTDVQLTQTGYQLTVVATHATTLEYRLAAAASGAAATSVEVARGQSRMCVPAAGEYVLTPRGCHTFAEAEYTTDTAAPAVVQLRAVAHRVSGAVRAAQPTDDVRVRLSVDAEVRELETHVSADRVLHQFSVIARPHQVLTFQPQSDTMLFWPTFRQLTAGEECQPDVVEFQARKGTFISGTISPSLAGARITVSAPEMEPIVATTDGNGTYQVGPLHPERQYEVDAEREGYVISRVSSRPGQFEARKLAELRVRVTDEAGRPLPGVLVSVSGGRQFRRNSLTDEDGRQVFLSLLPGQYFIRPMMKEYEFTPASKMAEIAEGATLDVTVSGRRVAYSLLGRTVSLCGEPESAVVVEAVSAGCDDHQEEATSDAAGALRIRGLRPQCEYTVRLKAGPDTNTLFSRGIPASQTVKVTDGDVTGWRVVAMRRIGETDVTVRVLASPEHLATLRLVVSAAASETPLLSQPLAGSPFVVVPAPLARDGREYVARLETSLSGATHTLRPTEAVFAADAPARHVTLTFTAERRPADTELGAGPVLGLPLTLLLVLLVVNQRRCLQLAARLRARYGARGAAPASRRESAATAGDGGGVIVRPVNVKVKTRKI